MFVVIIINVTIQCIRQFLIIVYFLSAYFRNDLIVYKPRNVISFQSSKKLEWYYDK